MKTINISVRDKLPVVTAMSGTAVADNTYRLKFEFDDEWESGLKTVVIVENRGQFVPYLMNADSIDVKLGSVRYVTVGVLQGTVMTSRPCQILVNESIRQRMETEISPPEPDVWAYITEQIRLLHDARVLVLDNAPDADTAGYITQAAFDKSTGRLYICTEGMAIGTNQPAEHYTWIPVRGYGIAARAPTENDEGAFGDLWIDAPNAVLYICTGYRVESGYRYIWMRISGGSGLPEVTENDEGKILGVLNGVPEWTIPGGKNIFFAEYNKTTYEEVRTAWENGKLLIVYDDPYYAWINAADYDLFRFTARDSNYLRVYILEENGIWTKLQYKIPNEKDVEEAIPKQLPNPYKLVIRGAGTEDVNYDGTEEVVLDLGAVPDSGGGSDAPGQGTPEEGAPDWGENDPEAAGYIKNRTHWVEYHSELRDVISATSTRNADTGAWSYVSGFYGYDGATGTSQYLINNGDVCTVVINGVAYECTCFSQTLSSDNATANEDTDWYYKSSGSFATFYMKDTNVSSAEIVIQKNVRIPTYHKIPNEFIDPDIKYDELSERPFYDDVEEIASNISFSGTSVSGLYSETTILPDVGDGALVTLDNVTYYFKCTAAYGGLYSEFECDDAPFTFRVNMMQYRYTDWMVNNVSDGDHVISVSKRSFKALDEKFIPDSVKPSAKTFVKNWNQNDPAELDYIMNRTHSIEYVIGEEVERWESSNGTAISEYTWYYSVTTGEDTSGNPPDPVFVSVNGKAPTPAVYVNDPAAKDADVIYYTTYFQTGSNSWSFENKYYLRSGELITSIVFYAGTIVYHPLSVEYLPVEDIRRAVLFKPAEYIEGDGASYIDTEFVPGSNTRVVCRALFANNGVTEYLFGARASSSAQRYSFYIASAKYTSGFYGGTKAFAADVMYTEPVTIDKNRSVVTLAGEAAVDHAVTTAFECPCSLTVFAVNTKGTKSSYSTARIYSMQIYDNDVLVRDFVPYFNNVLGEYGLYDRLNDKFHRNRGTGIFGGALA